LFDTSHEGPVMVPARLAELLETMPDAPEMGWPVELDTGDAAPVLGAGGNGLPGTQAVRATAPIAMAEIQV
jgi:hypothetical protein